MAPLRSRSRVLHLSDSSDDDLDLCVVAPAPPPPPRSPSIDEIDDISVEDEPQVAVEHPTAPITWEDPSLVSTTPVPSTSPFAAAPRPHSQQGIGEFVPHSEGSPLEGLFRRRGVHMEPRLLASCLQEMEGLHPGFRSYGVERQGEIVFGHLLVADFNAVGAACLPNSFEGLHATELAGPFVLQVDEISDIGCPLRERYQERAATPSRCLKLSLTDGVQRVVGIEYRPIPAFHCLSPAGLKICVRNVHVRRGVFLLVPEIVEVLGGFVQSLEEARQRAMHEVNKPARGSRTHRGNIENRPLAERATAAAWLNNATDGPVAATAAGPEVNVTTEPAGLRQPPAASSFQSSVAQPEPGPGPQILRASCTASHFQQSSHVSGIETRVNIAVEQAVPGSVGRTAVNTSGRQTVSVSGLQTLNTTTVEVKRRQSTLPWAQTSTSGQVLQDKVPHMPTSVLGRLSLGSRFKSQQVAGNTSTHEPSDQPSAPGAGVQTPMNLDSDEDDLHTEDSAAAPMQSHQTPVFNEAPFTYLALLQEKLNLDLGRAVVAGTIKVVQAMVGYSPKEVSGALASSNRQEAQEMKNVMKQFQAFLKRFEGWMDVECRRSSAIPVVLRMTEGAEALDLDSLRERVSKYPPLRQPGLEVDPTTLIDISSP